jgi:hypothetical protein
MGLIVALPVSPSAQTGEDDDSDGSQIAGAMKLDGPGGS